MGEEALSLERHDWLHWETIQSRSRLHDYRIAPHRHEQFFQVLYLQGGIARVTLDDIVHDLVPPALAVVPALTVHGYAFSNNVEGIVVTVMERDLVQPGLRGEPGRQPLIGMGAYSRHMSPPSVFTVDPVM